MIWARSAAAGEFRACSPSPAAESTTRALGHSRETVDDLSRLPADLRSVVSRFTY